MKYIPSVDDTGTIRVSQSGTGGTVHVLPGTEPTGTIGVSSKTEDKKLVILDKSGTNVADATATPEQVLQGATYYAGTPGKKSGTMPYMQSVQVVPGDERQVIAGGMYVAGDIICEPIPSNYGKISWNGGSLKIT